MRYKRKLIKVFECFECGSIPAGIDEDGCCIGCGCDLNSPKNVVRLVRRYSAKRKQKMTMSHLRIKTLEEIALMDKVKP